MGVSAKYTLDIKDIAFVSGSVEMTVQLDKYIATSYQDTVAVETKLLSEVTTPGYYVPSVGSTTISALSVVYLPIYLGESYLVSATQPEGFQYAIAYFHANIRSAILGDPDPYGWLVASCQFGYDGVTWYDSTYQCVVKLSEYDSSPGDEQYYDSINGSFMIPGSSTPVQLYVRWKLNNLYDSTLFVMYYSVGLDIIPRHQHIWSQTGQPDNTLQAVQVDDASMVGSTPETIDCSINGGATFPIACMSPSFRNNLDIKSYLVTGVNTIEFISTTKCSVTPSATYLALPT